MEESSPPGQSTSDHFDLRIFGKDTLIYSFGQGTILLLGFIQILIIPKYLSVEHYGYWQLFMLYAEYVGIFHLGFIDGILVRWAGKETEQIGNEINMAVKFLILELVVIITPLASVLYFLTTPPSQVIALMLLAHAFLSGLFMFFIFTSQATRQFKLVTVVEVGRTATFILFIVALFVFDWLDYRSVIVFFLVSFLFPLFAFAFRFRKYLRGSKTPLRFLWAYGKNNISIGVFVLLGSFVLMLFLTIDRLMVSAFFNVEQFAIYAFAIVGSTIIYAFVRAISQVFFPNLSAMSNEIKIQTYQVGKPIIILSWALILILYFPISGVVEHYLPDYTESLPIMQILLCTVGFGSLIRILHANYYKVYRMQRRYFFWAVAGLTYSIVLNLIAIKLFGTLESIAIATLIGFGIWYIINELNLKLVVKENNQQIWKYFLVICSYSGAFLFATTIVDWFVAQMFIYVCLFCFLTLLLLREEVRKAATVIRRTSNNMRPI